MNFFNYRDGELWVEDVPTREIARRFGTPCYLYSRAALTEQFLAYRRALSDAPHHICYAVKANSSLAVLEVLVRLDAGFDIVSVGELERVLLAGGNPAKVVFSGVGKQISEMRRALEVGVLCFNVESEAELQTLNRVAGEAGMTANISLRVNPDVDANSHPYISTGLLHNKFGIDIRRAADLYLTAAGLPHLNIVGIGCHIGSQLVDDRPLLDALDRVLVLVDKLAERGINLQHIDLGGGLGVRYRDESPPTPESYLGRVRKRLQGKNLSLIVEPGRSIVANAGALLTQILYLKSGEEKNFAIVDAAMNDLARPSLYQAWQDIIPLVPRRGDALIYDVVGPVCETGDFIGKDRELVIEPGDWLCVAGSGAYGFTMSSNYNSRGRPPEVMVDGDRIHLIRRRETIDDMVRGESLLPD